MLTVTQPELLPWHSALYRMTTFWLAAPVLKASAVAPLSVSGMVVTVALPVNAPARVAIARMFALAAEAPPMTATAAVSASTEYRRKLVILNSLLLTGPGRESPALGLGNLSLESPSGRFANPRR